MKNRIGKFRISRDSIENAPVIVMMVMARCIVIRAELFYEYDAVEYTAISPEFDIAPTGEIAPEYRIEITRDEAGADSIMFERI